jgi:NADPH:quinone reductase-like Zn-dependent oxidoreductase
MTSNKAAWLHKPGTPLEVGDAPMPIPGPNEIVIQNSAIAINPLDTHMQDAGVFVQQWPAIFGCDVAGTVYQVGSEVQRFKKGDRVIGYHSPAIVCCIQHLTRTNVRIGMQSPW